MRIFRSLLVTWAVAIGLAAAVVASGSLQPVAVSTVSGVRLNSYEARILTLLNSARAAAGVAPVTIVPGLSDVARTWAYEQAKSSTMKHNLNLRNDLDSHGSAWHYAAENVGTAPSNDPDTLFRAFMQSPGHRRNNLDPRARYIGLGAAEELMPTGGLQAYVTMDFTDAYSRTYGASRVASAGMARDKWSPDSSHPIPTIRVGDQRLDTAAYSGPVVGLVSFAQALLGIGAVVSFQDNGGSGSSRIRYHDALALSPGRKIVVTLAAQTRTGGKIKVALDMHNAAAGYKSNPVYVTLGSVAQNVTLTVPPHFTQPVTEIGIQVASLDLRAISSIASQRYVRIVLMGISA